MTYVYRHIRLDKNEPFYIGIGVQDKFRRAYLKQSRNQLWKNIVAKTDYEVEILFDDLTWEEAGTKEIEFISLYGRKDNGGILANLTDGGGGIIGYKHTEEAKRKIGIASKNKPRQVLSEERKQHLREINLGKIGANKGKSPSKETREKIANTLRGRVGPNKGKQMSEEAKRKMILTKTGKPSLKKGTTLSDEIKKKVSEGLKKYFANKRLENDKF